MTRYSRRGHFALAACLALAVLLSSKPVAWAQTGGPYDLRWHNIGPGGSASGGSYSLDASIGQPDAATVRNHVSTIFNKLQVADRAQAMDVARRKGLG